MEKLDTTVKNIKSNAERAVKDRELNLAEIQNQRQKFHVEIKQIRNKINEHLDSLEQRILQDVYAAEKKVKSQTENLLGKLAENIESLDLLQTNMSAIKEYGSDLQAYFWSKLFEKDIQKHEIFMKSLFENGSLKKIDINCKIQDLSDILSTVTSFGSVTVESGSPLVVVQTEMDKQAHTFQRAPPTPIYDIKMASKSCFDFTGVTGCSVSCAETLFLIDTSQPRLLILNKDGTLKSDIPLSESYQVGVTCIDDETVAVSFPGSEQIQIINITTKNVESTIKTVGKCFGIYYIDGYLLYCVAKRGIQKVTLSDKCSSNLVKDDTLSVWSYVTTAEDKIFYTNRSNSVVTCCSMTGKKVWEYNHQSVCSPTGKAVDNDSIVYVASSHHNTIVVMSSNGKLARKLLGDDARINNPYGLSFDEKKENLRVCNYYGPVLYELY
ncbi:uncharacterized protein LOC134716844 [Mytilus trossulus]|uniref:uncharacterized protein LOC134716844 n=1 Tax=Mytilus trossulus TaxID=6551 RepID=UPI00300756F0